MVKLKLPDGSVREVAPGTRPREVAESIGKRLAQAAVAAKVNDEIVDLERELSDGEHSFQLLTDKDPLALDVLRHSTAHIMARAVMRLFPGTQLAFGPTLETGFYYDIDSPTPIREEDFPRIEAEMKAIIDAAEPFERFERSIAEGSKLAADMKQKLKVQHIDEELSKHPSVSFYRQGEFIDLCRGPHIPHAGKVGAFKLLSIAGAYWKGNAANQQLQRLYGTAFFDKKSLDAYMTQVEEARKRDHRVLGKQLKLFTISQIAGQGMILWMPKGATVRHQLESFIREQLVKRDYTPVYTPHIGNLNLYRTSGHFPYYSDSQFPPMYMNPLASTVDTCCSMMEKKVLTAEQEAAFLGVVKSISDGADVPVENDLPRYPLAQMRDDARALLEEYAKAKDPAARLKSLQDWMTEQEGYLLKPMNCPQHIQIYKADPKSYRDLPVKLAEFGTVYRFEQSGELGGMTRVRGFTQDDAHLFVTPEQVESELRSELDLVLFVLQTLGLTDYRVRVSVREPGSDKYVGAADLWDKAEATLESVVKNYSGLNYSIGVGEAAFYGPKIDFIVRDCIGREWQLGTVQLDYNLPIRFGLEYAGADNLPHRPVMIHRAPFGSMERFCGILIEHFAGAFPLWLAPEQARVLTISDKSEAYGRKIEADLRAAGFRVSGDYRAEKIGAKVREAQLEKVPYMLVVGEKDMNAGTVSIRDRVDGELGAKPFAEVLDLLAREVSGKTIRGISTATAAMNDAVAKFAE